MCATRPLSPSHPLGQGQEAEESQQQRLQTVWSRLQLSSQQSMEMAIKYSSHQNHHHIRKVHVCLIRFDWTPIVLYTVAVVVHVDYEWTPIVWLLWYLLATSGLPLCIVVLVGYEWTPIVWLLWYMLATSGLPLRVDSHCVLWYLLATSGLPLCIVVLVGYEWTPIVYCGTCWLRVDSHCVLWYMLATSGLPLCGTCWL